MSQPQVRISFGDRLSPAWESGGCSALIRDAAGVVCGGNQSCPEGFIPLEAGIGFVKWAGNGALQNALFSLFCQRERYPGSWRGEKLPRSLSPNQDPSVPAAGAGCCSVSAGTEGPAGLWDAERSSLMYPPSLRLSRNPHHRPRTA